MFETCILKSESILRVKSEPESCPSPSQAELQVSGIPFFQSRGTERKNR